MNSESAAQQQKESPEVDFKAHVPSDVGGWLELVKDIAAMSNSGGGFIVFGVNDDGSLATLTSDDQACDAAGVVDKMFKYTDRQLADLHFVTCPRGEASVLVLCMGGVEVPIIFTSPGTYPNPEEPKKQKTAFANGAVYFRHGPKSDLGTPDDFRSFFDRVLEAVRRKWMEGIAKIVEAPTGSTIQVLPPGIRPSIEPTATPIRVVDDPSAPSFNVHKVDDGYPYRQKEVISELKKRLPEIAINTHHIVRIRRKFGIDSNVNYCHGQKHASNQYSHAFVEWIIQRYAEDPNFFMNCIQEV